MDKHEFARVAGPIPDDLFELMRVTQSAPRLRELLAELLTNFRRAHGLPHTDYAAPRRARHEEDLVR